MRILDWKVVQLGSTMVSLAVCSNVQYVRWQSRRQDAARTNGSAWKDDRMGGGAGQGDKSNDGQAFVSFRLPRVMAACHPTLPCLSDSVALGKQVAYRSHTFVLDHLRQSSLYQSPNHPITPSDQPNTPKHHHNARRKLLRKAPSTNPPTRTHNTKTNTIHPHRSSTPRAPTSTWTTTSPPTCPSPTSHGPTLASRAGASSSSAPTATTASKPSSSGTARRAPRRLWLPRPPVSSWPMSRTFPTRLLPF